MTEDINICEADIQVFNNVARVSSLVVAKRFGKRHDNLLQSFDNLKLNPEFTLLNFQECKYLNKKGNECRMLMMTRDGFTIVAMGLTGSEALKFKLAYIAAFNKMEEIIRSGKGIPDTVPLLVWDRARLEGKVARRNLTDTIRNELIPHALSKGSKNAGKYYIHYSKLMHLFLEDRDFEAPTGSNLRGCLCVTDLAFFRKTEDMLAELIRNEIAKDTDYKEIYQICKERVFKVIEWFGKMEPSLPPKSPIPALKQSDLPAEYN